MAQIESLKINIVISLILLLVQSLHADAKNSGLGRQCSDGLNTPGYTEPHGDILIEFGDPLDITCVLNDEYLKEHGENSSKNLYFVRGKEVIPSEMIEELNSSSIRLHIENPPKSQSVYTCKLRNDTQAVCLNHVVVGTKPLPVEDFSCIGYNYENLTCAWTTPENYAVTNYSLTYFFPGRAGRYLRNTCPNITKLGNNRMSCLWTVTSNPQYRQAQRTYYFELNSANALGTNQLNITFSHFQHVLSGPPENLTLINTTSDSILLRWSVPYAMQAFPPGLQHRVLYQSEYGGKEWQFGGLIQTITSAEMKFVHYNLTGLKFAHAIYDIRVSLRSYAAEPDDESMWSKNSSITARTRSKVPGAPPVINVGSFEVVTSGESMNVREIYVYWQQIPEEIKNGENFVYDIEVDFVNAQYSMIQPAEVTNAYAKFKNLSVGESFTFNIWSRNSIGRSLERSTIFVPKQSERVVEPLLFTKIAYGEGRYELSWEPPKNLNSVKNYTIFWCSHDRDRPYQCTGYLSWIEIPSYKRMYNITVSEDKIHQFAISANTETSSSGMVWAACTVIHNQAVGKMRSVWVNRVGSTFIELSWKLDCSDRIGSVEGFVIYYCNIVGPSDSSCKGPEKNLTIYGSHGASSIELANITGLEPYKTYMLAASVITKHSSVSQKSDYLLGTTLEGAPSSPTNVNIMDVTNSTISVSWEKPIYTNGKLKYYMILYNNFSDRVDSDFNEFTISNLVSYVSYNVSVIACTVECSKPSVTHRIQTKGGYPGKTSQPGVSFQNDSDIVVEWDRPLQPRGNNDIFEVNFKEKLQYENKSNAIVNVTDTKYIIKDCGGDGQYNSFYISVRAVNIFNGTRYEGPWSDELESYCRTSPNLLIWILIPVCVILGLLIIFLGKKTYFHCQKMRDVEVKLPPGLAPVVISDKGLSHWGGTKLQEDPVHHLTADEELLLIKMADNRIANGDSSGCSSAHESVISSDSTTNSISTVDSGTDQPRLSNEDLHTNSLRQRNVANKGYVSMPTENVNSAWSPKVNLSSGYCVLGVDSTPIISVNPNYVPVPLIPHEPVKLPEQSDATTPYVIIGASNNSKSNYVPLETLEVNEKNLNRAITANKSVPDLMRLESIRSTESNDITMPYVQRADASGIVPKLTPNSFICQHPVSPITGYVSVGDPPPRRAATEITKGYVPHRQFEAKTLKED